jgi:hypothetical protein
LATKFALHWNSLYNLQNQAKTRTFGNNQDNTVVANFTEDEADTEEEVDELPPINDQLLHHLKKRKQVSLCRHKLQGGAYPQFRSRKQATEQPRHLPTLEEVGTVHEGIQLLQMERMIEMHKQKLLKNGA